MLEYFKLFSCDFSVSNFVLVFKTISKIARLGEQMKNFLSAWPEHSWLLIEASSFRESLFYAMPKCTAQPKLLHFTCAWCHTTRPESSEKEIVEELREGEKHLRYLKMK